MITPDDLPDSLADFFPTGSNSTSDRAKLRESILARTTSVIRRRRRLKLAGFAAALVGCYVAGMGTIVAWRSSEMPERMAVAANQVGPLAPGSAGGSAPTDQPIRPEDDGIFPNVKSVPSHVAVQKLTAYDRLCQAGDRQLEEQNDIAAAAHTYHQALKVANFDQRSISVNHDNWLLMAMKNDHSE